MMMFYIRRLLFGVWLGYIGFFISKMLFSIKLGIRFNELPDVYTGAAFVIGMIVYIIASVLQFVPLRKKPKGTDVIGEHFTQNRHSRGLELKKLTLLIHNENNRFGNDVKRSDRAIRPYGEFSLTDKRLDGEQCKGRFTIRCQWFFLVYSWHFDVPVTCKIGLNKVWPQRSEFPIRGKFRKFGRWSVTFSLSRGDGKTLLDGESPFTIQKYLIAARTGPDASLTKSIEREAVTRYNGESVEKLLKKK
jgi:hypothetical protein